MFLGFTTQQLAEQLQKTRPDPCVKRQEQLQACSFGSSWAIAPKLLRRLFNIKVSGGRVSNWFLVFRAESSGRIEGSLGELNFEA